MPVCKHCWVVIEYLLSTRRNIRLTALSGAILEYTNIYTNA